MHTPLVGQIEGRPETASKPHRRAWSLKAHFLVFGLVLVLPLAILVAFLIFKITETNRAQLEERMLQVAAGLADAIDRELQRRLTILQTLATSPVLAQGDLATFHAHALAALGEDKAGIFLIDAPTLQQLVNTYTEFGTMLPTYGSPETAERVFKSKTWQVSNFFIGRVSKRPAFDIVIPVLEGDEIRYLLAMGLEPFMLQRILEGQKLSAEWALLVADGNGTILARSIEQDRYVGTRLPADLRDQQSNVVRATRSLDGIPVLRAAAVSQLSGWQVAVILPVSAAGRLLWEGLLLLAFWSAAAAVLAVLIASWFARAMARPITAAQHAAAELAHRRAISPLDSHITEANNLIAALRQAADELSEADSRLKAEQDTKEALSRERELLIESAPNGILVVDPVGRIRMANTPLQDLFGYDHDELIGQSVEILIPERFRRGHANLRAGFAAHPSTRPMGAGRDLYGLRKDGKEFPVEIGLSSFAASDGNLSVAVVTDITARKEAEERRSLLASIVESSRDAIISKSLDGMVTSWNPGAEALFGYSASEMIGQSIKQIIPAEWAVEEDAILDRLKAGRTVEHYETERITRNGERLPVAVTVSPIKDLAGKIVGASTTVRDITERKRAERTLTEHARQQAALYQLADQFHRADSLITIYTAALDAILDALHCSRASILLRDDAGIMRFTAWRNLSDEYRRAVDGHSPWTGKELYPQPVYVGDVAAEIDEPLKSVVTGEGIRALAFIPLVANGKLIGKFMIYYDSPHAFSGEERNIGLAIARQLALSIVRKRAEESLRESERRLEIALAAGRMGAWEWDVRKNRVFWSPGLEEIHGLKSGTFGGSFEDFQRDIHPDDVNSVLGQIRHAIETQEDYHVVYRMLRPDGEVRWLEAFGKIVLGPDLEPRRLAGVCIDVTERKRAEETKRLLTAELEHRTRNLLAVVHAVAMRSLRGEHSLDEAREAFVGRLLALARSDQRLTNSAWKGAMLNEIVVAEMNPFAGRVKVDGAPVLLNPKDAQNLTLALHELATNAVKYGALSKPEGEVAISWQVARNGDGGTLEFCWKERGGPPVQPPTRKGFGTSLLESTLGKARVDYAPEGLTYEIELSLSEAAPQANALN